MTKKHFIMFANVIKKIKEKDDRASMAYAIAEVLYKSNHKFRFDLFYKACSVEV